MHLKLRHEITCRFAMPIRNLVAVLRLSPRSHEGQHVSEWWIDSDIDCSLKSGGDEFGNLTHTFSATGPLSAITIVANGLVDTFDTAGVTRGTAERMPVEIFLRDTTLTQCDAAVRTFANDTTATDPDRLGKLHALMGVIHKTVAFTQGGTPPTATEVLKAGSGDSSGHAHIFIAAARHLGIPSRYVSGYLTTARPDQTKLHGWAESFVPGLGWIGFDTVTDLCPSGEYVRVATGLDATGAAFIRGAGSDHARHTVTITLER